MTLPEMTNIVERLRDYALSDHHRGCPGRCYSCECGYDDKRDRLLKEAADEIERLRAALDSALGDKQTRAGMAKLGSLGA